MIRQKVREPKRGAFRAWFFEPVDNSGLVLFRILFGGLLAAECGGAILTGWVTEALVQPPYTFPMFGFGWVRPLPGYGMYVYFAVMALLGVLVMIGAYFRVALGLFTLLWTGTYVMQTLNYNNHYYLLILLCVLLLVTPANAAYAWDAQVDPSRRSATCPRWCILVFVFQIAIVYFYAAVAKLYPDWLNGMALSSLLRNRVHYPFIGWLYREAWVVAFLVYGGILFDALVVPLLLWRRTRVFAVALSVFFHLFNSITFRIGIFPYLALALCAFFFPPEEVRRVVFRESPLSPAEAAGPVTPHRRQQWILTCLTLYFIVQIVLPLRHWLYPGNVHWTEEGHRMAWHMMLRSKTGNAIFVVKDPLGTKTWTVSPRAYFSSKHANRIATDPERIWLYSQRLKAEYAAQAAGPVEVYAITSVSLNGRKAQPLVDRDVNLAAVQWRWLGSTPWVVPLQP